MTALTVDLRPNPALGAGGAGPLATDLVLLLLEQALRYEADLTELTVQKLAWAAAEAMGVDVGHAATFYGPHSSQLSGAFARLVAAGDVVQRRNPGKPWGPDTAYRYGLSTRGIVEAAAAEAERPECATRATAVFEHVNPTSSVNGPRSLVAAAKAASILNRLQAPLATNRARQVLITIGWPLSPSEFDRAATMTVALLGFIR